MPTGILTFDQYEFDPSARRLTRDGQVVTVADRHFDVLHQLLRHAGRLVTKDDLVTAGWGDVAVTDNSLEQAISVLRRTLGSRPDGSAYIDTVPRRGYRFGGPVEHKVGRVSEQGLDALIAPHRAWLEGRAALESLDGAQVARARQAFELALESFPDHALAHVGMANACAMRFEMTRADADRDLAALSRAAHHAREACRLDPASAEAWATLGFVTACSGPSLEAIAALRRAATLEPDNWRHHFRLGYAGWGEERLRAARRTLALLPGFPQAHWLAATVHVARNALSEAEKELTRGIATQQLEGERGRFNAVALHWLLGLVLLACGDEEGALAAFERELAGEASGHLYARECCANTWYAIGSLRVRQQRPGDAVDAFEHALTRVPDHPLSRVGLSVATGNATDDARSLRQGDFDAAWGTAVRLSVKGSTAEAVRVVDEALALAPPGNAGWLLPVEPLIHIAQTPAPWVPVLARLRSRAA